MGRVLRLCSGQLEAVCPPEPGPDGIPPAALTEIIERGRRTDGTAGGSVVVPDEIRVNGQPLLAERGGIRVHEMGLCDGDAARVTVTLFARRVVIAAEHDL